MKAWEWTRRGVMLAALGAAAVGAMAAAPEPIPVQVFFESPAIREAVLSPSGRHLAIIAKNKDDHTQLVILDTETMKPFVAAGSPKLDVVGPIWVNDKRLIYRLGDLERTYSYYAGIGGMYAVDRDGGEPRDLMGTSSERTMNFNPPSFAGTTWMRDSDTIFVAMPQTANHYELDHVLVRKLDTRTGRMTPLPAFSRGWGWTFDPDDEPRFVTTVAREGKGTNYVRDPATGEWKDIGSYDIFAGEGDLDVVGFADRNTAYVVRKPKGHEFKALYTFDIKARTFSADPLVEAKGFDLEPVIIRSRNQVLGVRYETDAVSTIWVDEGMKKMQADIDKVLPSTINVISVPLRAEVPIALVRAYSDQVPTVIFLYDTKTGKLQEIGKSRPAVDPARMAQLDFVKLKTRDGLSMPAWVTTPRDGKKGPRPMVVLVHGGPYVRGGSWNWSPDAQFLASRGYLVLEPEFRGSTGFGFSYFKAGWKQWGLGMQNDVADATRWAIEKGMADPKRICIAGASYGGYATLMGLANDPDLYKCGINWVGVTDIDLLYSITWSDSSELYKQYGMPVLVADREKDAAQIKATSPIQLAAKIRQPLMLAYGGEDDRVPMKHGTAFRDAVMQTNPNVEWIEYPYEGHGWFQLKNNVDFWTRVEKFLAKNIGQ
ncbi:prolyl oligopeptidase family serine peptidase [Ramlibacter algicola]|uniref:S9 family peptidase n=1 Tax=Ramlibacter algicola TaxID=2795217 RepID=A0A934Q143_9BURK|nr:prolyl oligopeptidase family serine peptidase [Ramlibacter algicola]MBK0394129.1 S9 family peptidase [Ramlibacter algicola]